MGLIRLKGCRGLVGFHGFRRPGAFRGLGVWADSVFKGLRELRGLRDLGGIRGLGDLGLGLRSGLLRGVAVRIFGSTIWGFGFGFLNFKCFKL